ncbi:MAG: hypothetical protein HY819_04535 [Acidobacteria bacterium]|nr:hypothetical protein [Acidobacteriota bacterium]
MYFEIFIKSCLTAMINNISLTNIFSLHSKLNREIIYLENNISKRYQLNIYRAQGGKIRLEKHDQEEKITTILNGSLGIEKTEVLSKKSPLLVKIISQNKITEIKRSVRIYPRNFLAHINEYKYSFKGLQLVDNTSIYVLDFLDEDVTYYFDASRFLCVNLFDRRNNTKTYYNNYQNIQGIFTPLEEKTISETQIQIDTIENIEYNLKLDEDLFKAE